MKICEKECKSKFGLNLLNSSMLEDQIKELRTTRSCPTGYSEQELRSTSTVELLYLRKTTYEYLNLKSSKTRNVQFILLVQRINKELMRRNVYIPVTCIDRGSYEGIASAQDNKSVEFDEVSHYIQNINNQDNGEYCYLTRKRGIKSNRLILDSIVICNSHFSITKHSERKIPEFLDDKITEPLLKEIQTQDYEECSSHSTSEVSKEKSKKVPKSPSKAMNEFFHYDDLGGFVPAINHNNHNDFDANEVLFLLQHN